MLIYLLIYLLGLFGLYATVFVIGAVQDYKWEIKKNQRTGN